MTFVDPETKLVIHCSPWEYEELRKKFVKTEIVVYGSSD